jgi:hypothetical protein
MLEITRHIMRIKVFQLQSLQACPRPFQGEVLPDIIALRRQQGRMPGTLPRHPHSSVFRPRRHNPNSRFLTAQLLSTATLAPFNTHTAERIEAV